MKVEVVETIGKVRKTIFGNVLEALKACGFNGKVEIVSDQKQRESPLYEVALFFPDISTKKPTKFNQWASLHLCSVANLFQADPISFQSEQSSILFVTPARRRVFLHI